MMRRRVRASIMVLALLQVALLSTVAAQPPAAPLALPLITGNSQLDHAERVALQVLTADQKGGAHRAAPFYVNPWIRDSYAWGMVPTDSGTLSTYAHSELLYWLKRQQPFGGWITFQYSGWYDETAILISAVLDAYRQTGDLNMVRAALPRLRKGWAWLHGGYTQPSHGSSCLVWATLRPQGKHWATDWADQVARVGYTPQLEGLWYRATLAMASMEWLLGNRDASYRYAHNAACIADDADRLLWHVEAPRHRDAKPLPAFGHFQAYPAQNGYFEVDGNALLLAAGIASPTQSSSVLSTVAAHAGYFLGGNGAGPARVVYGDYAPSDYAPIHNWMGAGQYQSAYWPTVGGLLALAAARSDNTALSLSVLLGLAARSDDAQSAFSEWYGADGAPHGAALYGWGARMYLLALYSAYLGIDDAPSITNPADLEIHAAPGPARAEFTRLGKRLTIITHGSGHFRYALVDKVRIAIPIIPATLFHNGTVIQIYRQG